MNATSKRKCQKEKNARLWRKGIFLQLSSGECNLIVTMDNSMRFSLKINLVLHQQSAQLKNIPEETILKYT